MSKYWPNEKEIKEYNKKKRITTKKIERELALIPDFNFNLSKKLKKEENKRTTELKRSSKNISKINSSKADQNLKNSIKLYEIGEDICQNTSKVSLNIDVKKMIIETKKRSAKEELERKLDL